jgi:hypothetical protein
MNRADFLGWLQEKDIVYKHCDLHTFEATGRGVVATSCIPSDTVVIQVSLHTSHADDCDHA